MTDTIDNSGSRTQQGRFGKGNPGRPRGSRNKTTVAVESLMGRYGEQIAQQVIDRACNGDMNAARLVLDRIAPPRRGRPVQFKLPEITDAESAMRAHAALLSEVAAGKLTPEEAEPVSAMLDSYVKIAVDQPTLVRTRVEIGIVDGRKLEDMTDAELTQLYRERAAIYGLA